MVEANELAATFIHSATCPETFCKLARVFCKFIQELNFSMFIPVDTFGYSSTLYKAFCQLSDDFQTVRSELDNCVCATQPMAIDTAPCGIRLVSVFYGANGSGGPVYMDGKFTKSKAPLYDMRARTALRNYLELATTFSKLLRPKLDDLETEYPHMNKVYCQRIKKLLVKIDTDTIKTCIELLQTPRHANDIPAGKKANPLPDNMMLYCRHESDPVFTGEELIKMWHHQTL